MLNVSPENSCIINNFFVPKSGNPRTQKETGFLQEIPGALPLQKLKRISFTCPNMNVLI